MAWRDHGEGQLALACSHATPGQRRRTNSLSGYRPRIALVSLDPATKPTRLLPGDSDPLALLAALDPENLALLDLPDLESAKAREGYAIARCQGLTNAIKHRVEGRLALRVRPSQSARNFSSKDSFS